MSIITSSTSITFNDSTTQSTGVPAPGTAGNALLSNGTIWTSSGLPQLITSAVFAPASCTANVSGTSLTITSMSFGIFNIGNAISFTGMTGSPTIVSQTSGTTGRTGVYVISATQGTYTNVTVTNGTGSGTFTVPSGVIGAKITMCGGGGGGGGSNAFSSGGAGTAGGSSSFGSFMTVSGGAGGAGNSGYSNGANGANGTSAIALYGLSFFNIIPTNGVPVDNTGKSIQNASYGLGGGGAVSNNGTGLDVYGGDGGTSVMSVANVTGLTPAATVTVTVGSGGARGGSGSGGGAGNQGFCLIEW